METLPPHTQVVYKLQTIIIIIDTGRLPRFLENLPKIKLVITIYYVYYDDRFYFSAEIQVW